MSADHGAQTIVPCLPNENRVAVIAVFLGDLNCMGVFELIVSMERTLADKNGNARPRFAGGGAVQALQKQFIHGRERCMKKQILLCVIAIVLLLAARSLQSETLPAQGNASLPPEASTSMPQPEDVNTTEKSDTEQQLEFLAAHFELWQAEEELDAWGYAVTDLDQNGKLEIVTTESHGSGNYTTTSIREVDADFQSLNLCGKGHSCNTDILQRLAAEGGPQSCGPLIAPHRYSNDAPQVYPVYYDSEENQYHYMFADSINEKGEWYGTFENWRSFSLRDGEITGVLLAYKTAAHGGRTEYWNMGGAYVNEESYESAVAQAYSDLDAMEAEILWISGRHLGEESAVDVYALLEQSLNSFEIQAK